MKTALFASIVKIDEAKHEVTGVLAEEAVDKVGEIFDYGTSKPLFLQWNEDFAKVTDGASVGNLREMHKPAVAGKFVAMDYDDAAKRISVTAKVVDPVAWKKCAEGCYTGFSIGGKIVRMWDDGDLRRYTARPVEGSLVDNPCMYGATFTAVKADLSTELRKFVGASVAKNLQDVADVAAILQHLDCIRQWATAEAAAEGDGSDVPAKLKSLVEQLGAVLQEMAAEESAELTAGEPEEEVVIEMNTTTDIEKAGAKHSQATKDHLAAIGKHADGIKDHLDQMGAAAAPADDKSGKGGEEKGKMNQPELHKIAEHDAALTKMAGEFADFRKDVTDAIKNLAEAVTKIAGQPTAPKAAKMAAPVEKTADNGESRAPSVTKSTQDLIREQHAAGGRRFR